MTESRPRTRRRLVSRLYGLAARINHDRLNDAQLAYLTAVLDHYNHAIKGMTEPTNLDDLDHRESINHYLSLCALVGEGRRLDAFAYIKSLTDVERIDMWLAGCSITIAFADDCRRFHKVPVELPAWLRLMALADEDGAQ